MSTSNSSTTSTKPICRICFSSRNQLIPSPCSCTGSLGFVHQRCFLRWICSVQRFDRCEICNQLYHGNVLPRRYENLFFACSNHIELAQEIGIPWKIVKYDSIFLYTEMHGCSLVLSFLVLFVLSAASPSICSCLLVLDFSSVTE